MVELIQHDDEPDHRPDLAAANHRPDLAAANHRRRLVDDRISNLPDYLLEEILSYLDVTEAVTSCILAKRWNLVWRGIPRINLHVNISSKVKGKNPNKILKLMDKVLELHSPCPGGFYSFSINFATAYTGFCLSRSASKWLDVVINHGVKKLYIHVHFFLVPPLPTIFKSHFLVSLHLEFRGRFATNVEITLPLCVSLVLKEVEFDDVDFLGRFLLGCPIVQSLIIHSHLGRIYNSEMNSYLLRAASSTLTQLELSLSDAPINVIPCIVQLDATSLRKVIINVSSHFDLFIQRRMTFKITSSLPLLFEVYSERNTVPEGHLFGPALCHSLLRIQNLALVSPLIIENLGRGADSFMELKELTLNIKIWNISIVLMILNQVPVLNVLRLEKSSGDEQHCGQYSCFESTLCIRSTLQEVTIIGYDGDPEIVAFVSMLLCFGGSLQKLMIRVCVQRREMVQKYREDILLLLGGPTQSRLFFSIS